MTPRIKTVSGPASQWYLDSVRSLLGLTLAGDALVSASSALLPEYRGHGIGDSKETLKPLQFWIRSC